jgi:hypothetical protein
MSSSKKPPEHPPAGDAALKQEAPADDKKDTAQEASATLSAGVETGCPPGDPPELAAGAECKLSEEEKTDLFAPKEAKVPVDANPFLEKLRAGDTLIIVNPKAGTMQLADDNDPEAILAWFNDLYPRASGRLNKHRDYYLAHGKNPYWKSQEALVRDFGRFESQAGRNGIITDAGKAKRG